MRGSGEPANSGQLVPLHARHGAALEGFLVQFDACREDLHGYFCERDLPIERCVDALDEMRRGVNIKPGWVPCTTLFWEERGVLQGVINVRHALTPALEELGGHIGYCVAPSHRRRGVATHMLRGALALCRELGIERALLTADLENPASWATIEKTSRQTRARRVARGPHVHPTLVLDRDRRFLTLPSNRRVSLTPLRRSVHGCTARGLQHRGEQSLWAGEQS